MSISAELALAIGRKLVQKYLAGDGVPRPADDLIPSEEEIAAGLKSLVDEFKLDLGGITEPAEITEKVLKLVTKGVKAIQANTGRLKADGVIGHRTRRWLFGKRFGHHERNIDSLPESATRVSPTQGSPMLLYFIEDPLPPVPNAVKLLREAFESWTTRLKLGANQTELRDKGQANLIVKTGVFPGNIVAKGDVGPPGNRQLNLTFDTSETWTAADFRATAAHEIGHILGIGHVTQSNQLMNDFLDPAINKPMDFDIAAAVDVGWKKR